MDSRTLKAMQQAKDLAAKRASKNLYPSLKTHYTPQKSECSTSSR